LSFGIQEKPGEDVLLSKTAKEAYRDKKVLVVGLARSGIGAANLLSSMGARVWGTDLKTREILKDGITSLLPSVTVCAGGYPEEIFNTADLIVISPGVPLKSPSIMNARDRGVSVIGELELAYQAIKPGMGNLQPADEGSTSPALPLIIGVTGTNGKSTTTTLINLMLKHSGYKTLLGGNIGNALTEELYHLEAGGKKLTADYLVAEISSFQLESIRDFKPDIGLILNITPDHLDRYDSMQDYITAKAALYKNQSSNDYLILNADDPLIMQCYKSGLNDPDSGLRNVKALFFSRSEEVDGVYVKNRSIFLKTHSTSTPRAVLSSFLQEQEEGAVPTPYELIGIEEIRLKGTHNLENAMAASLAAVVSGCPLESIKSVLRDFPGLEHRLEYIGKIGGVRFINDSKGTNVGATARSLESLQNVVLIMGGRDKGGDFSALKELVGKRVKTLLLLGEAREKIARQLGNAAETVFVHDLHEAVEVSVSKACKGDVVLLSPGCTSHDMFADFEERGRRFKEIVLGRGGQPV
jgi:UDP-N-acetylmuramoylalanine--D-glutamate ligase